MKKGDMIVSITGHRPNKLGGYKVPNALYNSVINGLNYAFDTLKPDFVITGMALGTDQWAAELCLKRGIKYIAAIPFQGQETQWPSYAQFKYENLVKKSHAAYIITPGPYAAHKMHLRNQWMVNSCDVLAAVWDGTSGGTASCIEFAQARQKKIFWVPFDNASKVPKVEASPTIEVSPLPKAIVQAPYQKDEASKFLEGVKAKAKEQAEEFKKTVEKMKKDQEKKLAPPPPSPPYVKLKTKKATPLHEVVNTLSEDQLLELKELLMEKDINGYSFEKENPKKESSKGKGTTPKHIYGRIIDIDD